MHVRTRWQQIAMMILPPLLACTMCALGLSSGCDRLLLPGILLGLAPGLMGMSCGERLQIRVSSLAFGASVLFAGWLLGVKMRVGILPVICARPEYFLLGGVLLGTAAATGKDASLLQAKRGWLPAGVLTILTFVVLYLAKAVSMTLFAEPLTLQKRVLLMLPPLLPLVFGIAIAYPREVRAPRAIWLSVCAIAVIGLAFVLCALMEQSRIFQASWGEQLNELLYRKARMADVTACALVQFGVLLRNGIPRCRKCR
jgi:hypothetical protein